MTTSPTPTCPEKCPAAHTIAQAMALLSVSRSKLYDLMNAELINFKRTHFGRRIMHAEIDRYLKDCQPKHTSGQLRTDSRGSTA